MNRVNAIDAPGDGRARNAGFSLLELMVAAGIFLLLFGALAQSLVSFHVALNDQQQRAVAAQHCRSVLNDMRAERAANPNSFPDAIIAKYPNNTAVPNLNTLPEELVVVSYGNPEANPLDVTVTCTWRNLAGRTIRFAMTSLLTDQ